MDAICYVCNKQTIEFLHRNFTELKAQHTGTSICEFIRTFLAGFHSVRNIFDDSNHICIKCLQQINDYDWMRHQTIVQEAKLRQLLLSTEVNWINIRNASVEIENDGDSNGLMFAKKELGNSDVKLEPGKDVARMRVQESIPSRPHTTTSSMSTVEGTSNLIPALQSNRKCIIVKMLKPMAKKKPLSIRQNGASNRKPLKNRENQTHRSSAAVLRNGNGILFSTTTKTLTKPSPPMTRNKPMANNKLQLQYAKPAMSYACLIAMALRNSHTGSLRVSEIYSFMCEHFPYFRTTTDDWKRSTRNALSANACFTKIEHKSSDAVSRYKCLWTIKPSEINGFEEKWKIQACRTPKLIHDAMAVPENLPALQRGEMKHGTLNGDFSGLGGFDDSEPVTQCESEPTDTAIDCKGKVKTEFVDDDSDMFDEINIEDLLLFQKVPYVEDSQTRLFDSDLQLQPLQECARHDDIDLSTDVAGYFQ